MARHCSICEHERRHDLEAALVNNVPFRTLAARENVSPSALKRHKTAHLPERLAQAKGAASVAQADDLLQQVRILQHRTLLQLKKAEEAEQAFVVLAAVREARKNVELLAKLTGELAQEGTTINILVNPLWLDLRAVVVNTLAPYPEAKAAVAAALLEVEARSARTQ